MNFTIDERDATKKDRQRFAGLREQIWERDGYQCVVCGMTMEELERVDVVIAAINKALANGWDRAVEDPADYVNWLMNGDKETRLEALLFNHDFAKALYGSEALNYYVEDVNMGQSNPPDGFQEGRVEIAIWQWHLQVMVTADDPIEYLRSTLDEG
jgi:hypothetical protein